MRHILIAMFFASSMQASSYSETSSHVVKQVSMLEAVGSEAVGFAGSPHAFYLLYNYLWYNSTASDIENMLLDTNPAVQIMGAKLLVTSPQHSLSPKLLDALTKSNNQISVGPGGCTFTNLTVAQVVMSLKSDSRYLGASPIHLALQKNQLSKYEGAISEESRISKAEASSSD